MGHKSWESGMCIVLGVPQLDALPILLVGQRSQRRTGLRKDDGL
jgi:hypothetical protein